MNQKHISHLIDDYIDGALNTKDRTLVELHIKECAQCQKELSELEAVVHDLHRLPKSIVPPERLQTVINQTLLQHGSNHHAAQNRTIGAVHILRSPWILRMAAGFTVLIGAGVLWLSLHKNVNDEHIIAQKMETLSPVQSVHHSYDVQNERMKNTGLQKHNEPVLPIKVQKESTLSARANKESKPAITDAHAIGVTIETPLPVKSQSKQTGFGILRGRIIDSTTGDPLIGANVMLKGMSLGAATDLNGEYKILNAPVGNDTIVVSSIGYKRQIAENVFVPSDSSRRLDFQLIPQAIAGDAIVVTAQASGQNMAINQQLSSGPIVSPSGGEAKKIEMRGLSRRTYIPINGRMSFESRSSFNTEDYSKIDENEFKDALTNPLSTFSIDVDAASYSNVRRFIQNGQLPPHDAVRIEELINYFNYDYPQPEGRHPFSLNTEVSRCPWNPSNTLLLVGLQGKTIDAEKLPPSNLVFLIDVSGSMNEPNKLPLVKAAFRVLVQQLRPQDRVAIVVYAGNAGVVLPSTSGNEKEKILDAIESLEAGGSTNGGEGIKLAYDIARQNFLREGNNRVILSTDGDFNIGISSEGELMRLIEDERHDNIFLSVIGVGEGNYKDAKMEKLADHGNGNYAYIDNIQEARKVLCEQMAGTLYTIAKDVKIQIEFNPAIVKSYRLIGYEDRLLNKEDFQDDKKDAGELGAGHTVTALYELVLHSQTSDTHTIDSLRYQTTHIKPESFRTDELLTVQLRYKLPSDTTSILMSTPVEKEAEYFEDASRNIRFASAVAMFGMILRDSKFRGNANYDLVLKCAQDSRGRDLEGHKAEFVKLVETCQILSGKREH